MPVLSSYLFSAVPSGSSVTMSYPPGFVPDAADVAGAKACLLSAEVSLPSSSYSLSWGASSVVVTNNSSSWPAGVMLFLSIPNVTASPTFVETVNNPMSGGFIKTIWVGTQAQYDAIATKDANTEYNIVA